MVGVFEFDSSWKQYLQGHLNPTCFWLCLGLVWIERQFSNTKRFDLSGLCKFFQDKSQLNKLRFLFSKRTCIICVANKMYLLLICPRSERRGAVFSLYETASGTHEGSRNVAKGWEVRGLPVVINGHHVRHNHIATLLCLLDILWYITMYILFIKDIYIYIDIYACFSLLNKAFSGSTRTPTSIPPPFLPPATFASPGKPSFEEALEVLRRMLRSVGVEQEH